MRHVLVLSTVLFACGAFACAAEHSSTLAGDRAELNGATSCDAEVALVCGPGQFDGCLEPGLTTAHVCVADADRQGAASCAQEILRECAPGLVDACTTATAVSGQHICIATSASTGTKGGPAGGTKGGPKGGSSPGKGVSCDQEIVLNCPGGSFDGCLASLTNEHVCVAEDDRNKVAPSCEREFLRACLAGFEDACLSGIAATHVCVKK